MRGVIAVGTVLVIALGAAACSETGTSDTGIDAEQTAAERSAEAARERRAARLEQAQREARAAARRERVRKARERRRRAAAKRRRAAERRRAQRQQQQQAAAAEPEPAAPAQPNCHPSYQGACLDPNSPDYDCAGGSGDGPDYTGPVQVVGDDPYDLDSDGDGSACESS